MKRVSFLTAITAVLLFVACQKTEDLLPAKNTTKTTNLSFKQEETVTTVSSGRGEEIPVFCGAPTMVKLIAGQNKEVGYITSNNDSENLYVTYTLTAPDWTLGSLRLYVGELNKAPVNRIGNPVPSQFPYSADPATPRTYTFIIPLANIPDCYIIAAHAEVKGRANEIAWGQGRQFMRKGNWAMYFEDCKNICNAQYLQ